MLRKSVSALLNSSFSTSFQLMAPSCQLPLFNVVQSSSASVAKAGSRKKRRNMYKESLMKNPVDDTVVDADGNLIEDKTIDEVVAGLDLNLSLEQRYYAELMKKKLYGSRRVRSEYRDIPNATEVQGEGNFMPKYAENAEDIINWAMTHVNPRAGPRNSRHTKRMEHKSAQIRANAATRKANVAAAKVVKQQKREKEQAKVEQYLELARKLYPHLDPLASLKPAPPKSKAAKSM